MRRLDSESTDRLLYQIPRKDTAMAVHFTLYLEEQPAEQLRRFMAAQSCSATAAVELLLRRVNPMHGSPPEPSRLAIEPTRLAVA